MFSIGLTGGIASGKSLVAARLAELGAVLIDADVLARQVVAPGTEGLAGIVDAFGPGMLLPDGSLDRAALGALVFADPAKRDALNGITHPLVRASARELSAAAGPTDIVVQDIPLLVETGQGAAFHLVVVVDADDETRIGRMREQRGMSRADAQSRIAAQASREQRLAAADVVLANNGDTAQVLAAVDALWDARLRPFAANLAAGRPAPHPGPAVLVPADPDWPAQAARLAGRIMHAAGDRAVAVDHIGSTSVPSLAAKDVIDLQLRVPSLAVADELAPDLAAAGYPVRPEVRADTPHTVWGRADGWAKRFHNAADPGRPVNLHVRVDGSPGADLALAFRDWLRANADARREYESVKRALAAAHAGDATTAGYAEAKEPWFASAVPRVIAAAGLT
ncbi:dephospho-CoA kinase [Specibacter cremeus]|uniref:dephospho-CoA kinase n=1 Tax=Specibacter cremeus TaxID=1629051 RepID=UPI000F78D570|nr:dephospho-CoA kinase [Specibacter cremeus]